MSNTAVLAPAFVQVLLTFFLLYLMGWVRLRATTSGAVRVRDIALGQLAWPDKVQQVSNAYHNQLQVPLLFFILVALTILVGKVDAVAVALAWLFVALRILHAWIHTTSNYVRYRFYAFLAGSSVLFLDWLWFALRVIAEGA